MKAAVLKITAHTPCTEVSAGVETVTPSEKLTIVIPADRQLNITEGATVCCGEPLCSSAGIGMFSPVSGFVSKIMVRVYDGRQKQIAVTITSDASKKQVKLFDTDNNSLLRTPEELQRQCSIAGYVFPGDIAGLLVVMVDEDIGLTSNRWCFEKETDRLITGLQIVKKMYPAVSISIAVSKKADSVAKNRVAPYGRIIEVMSSYPDTRAEVIIQKDALLKKASKVVLLNSQQLVSLAGSLGSGYASVTQLVTLRIGKKGVARLFQVPFGTSILAFLQAVNCQVQTGMQIIIGGECTGVACSDVSRPLMPGDAALWVVPPNEVVPVENSACVRCGRCNRVCPAQLCVDVLGKCSELRRYDEAQRLGVMYCIECGLCAAVCCTRRPLAHLMASAKQHIQQAII